MRILCACAAYPPHGKGGGPKASESIAKALCARGHTVRVLNIADDVGIEIRDGVEVKTLRSFNIYWNYWIKQPASKKVIWHVLENFNPRALLQMRREIAEFGPDIVLTISSENINVATWVAARMMGFPSAHVIHSYFLMCWRGTMFSKNENCTRPCWQCRAASIGKKLCSQIVDGVTAESSHPLSLHCDYGYFKRATARVIPPAVIRPSGAPSLSDAQTGNIRVGFIGMLTPNKGIGTLGQAATLLGKDAPFEYLIAGNGRPEFVQQMRAIFPAFSTKFLGWVNPALFYPNIDILVVPSISPEPFPNVTIEALSYGIPAIVARSGALPEIVENDRSGLVFTAGDPEALAACLRRVATDRSLLQRLRDGALGRAERYTPEALGMSFETFLNAVRAGVRNGRSLSVTLSNK